LLYGERAKAIGLGKNFAPNRLHVIYNSLDYDRQKQVRTQLEIAFPEPQSELYFLCIARLTPAIRLDLAITALRIVRETVGMQIPLVLIGEGEMRSPLEEAARNENVEVRFLGAIYEEEEIGRWIYRARAVVSPGKAGLTAMHGLAYGVPIITHGDFDTQMPEFEAICPGVTGDFFQAGNAEALAKVLADWAQKPRLPRERQAAVESIERRYTPERQVEFIEQALSSHESDSK
jgi:glycosyltransferase involved in cell wall biosynthesis